jgi:hypothetical protein
MHECITSYASSFTVCLPLVSILSFLSFQRVPESAGDLIWPFHFRSKGETSDGWSQNTLIPRKICFVWASLWHFDNDTHCPVTPVRTRSKKKLSATPPSHGAAPSSPRYLHLAACHLHPRPLRPSMTLAPAAGPFFSSLGQPDLCVGPFFLCRPTRARR